MSSTKENTDILLGFILLNNKLVELKLNFKNDFKIVFSNETF